MCHTHPTGALSWCQHKQGFVYNTPSDVFTQCSTTLVMFNCTSLGYQLLQLAHASALGAHAYNNLLGGPLWYMM